jgi:hypothetical protein
MTWNSSARKSKKSLESGAAMLIAIFALLLISVVAIALVVTSGTDTSLAGNYRSATSAYYAGVAGLEEARGRLLWKNLDFINKTGGYSNVFDPSGVLPSWGLTTVLYITNPGPGETVDPTGSNPVNYADTQYSQEFPNWGLSGATVLPPIASVSPGVSLPSGDTLPGPNYKWVRINPVTEQSLQLDVNGDGVLDGASVLFYDPAHVNSSNQPAPSLVVPTVPSTPPTLTSVQALEITAFAVAPNGGHRLLQYVVAPLVISPDVADQSFPAALTLDGNNVTFQVTQGLNYFVRGVDGCNPPPPPGLPGAVPSIGVTNSADYASVFTLVNQPPDRPVYPGAPLLTAPAPQNFAPTTPSLSNLNPGIPNMGLRQSWLQPAALDSVMQDIVNSADLVIPGSATGTDISNRAPLMSASNPMTIVVNGDLNLNAWRNVGYGLLLVTGTLYYDPDASWNGVVLVVGQGIFSSSKNGSGVINGALFIAKTRDGSGNLLPGVTLGSAFYGSQTSFGTNPGYGINFNSCSVNSAKGPLTYKVLSFHEIPLPN